MDAIASLHHFSLTVRDLDASVAWYQDVFELAPMMDEEHPGGRAVVLVHPRTQVFVGLHAHDTADGARFSETRTGLDHLAFGVSSRAALEGWLARLDERGIEHSEIKDRGYGSILTFRDPDNIQLELYAPPAAG